MLISATFCVCLPKIRSLYFLVAVDGCCFICFFQLWFCHTSGCMLVFSCTFFTIFCHVEVFYNCLYTVWVELKGRMITYSYLHARHLDSSGYLSPWQQDHIDRLIFILYQIVFDKLALLCFDQFFFFFQSSNWFDRILMNSISKQTPQTCKHFRYMKVIFVLL